MMRLTKNKIVAGVILVLLTLAPATTAEEYRQVSGIKFAENYSQNGIEMELAGAGPKKMLFMKIFAAGLYLEEGVSIKDVLKNVPKRIEVSYYYPISGKRINRYTVDHMRDHMSKKDFEVASEGFERMAEYLIDLKPGDHYSLTYLPGVGTKFAYNGEEIGVIAGEEFARGLFAVWVGDDPMDKRLRSYMVGGFDKEKKASQALDRVR